MSIAPVRPDPFKRGPPCDPRETLPAFNPKPHIRLHVRVTPDGVLWSASCGVLSCGTAYHVRPGDAVKTVLSALRFVQYQNGWLVA